MKFRMTLSGALAIAIISAPVQAQSLKDIAKSLLTKKNEPARTQLEVEQDDQQENQKTSGSDVAGGIGCAIGGGLAATLIKGKVGKILGGAVFCAVGWKLGKALTKKDKVALTEKAQQMLAIDSPVSEQWRAPESGELVSLTTEPAVSTVKEINVVMDSRVEPPASGLQINSVTYVAADVVKFRSAPRDEGEVNILGFFNKGESIEIIGRTADGNWAILGDGGLVIGYAEFRQNGKLVIGTPDEIRKVMEAAAAKSAATKTRAKGRRVPVKQANVAVPVLRVGERAKPQFVAGAAKQRTTKEAKVTASTQCKAVLASIGKRADRKSGCLAQNGTWQLG